MGNYTRSGTSRYGTPAELNDSLQVMQLKEDKASTWTIDKGNDKEQYNVKSANRTLQRQLDEVVVPMEDKYTIGAWVKGAGTHVVAAAAPTSANIIGEIGKMKLAMDEALVPPNGRFLFIPFEYANAITDSSAFVYTEKFANKQIVTGEIGEVKGFRLIPVPADYMPTGVYMLGCYSDAILNPFKLREYKIHTDPPGINGALVELRVLYDAFVLDAKATAVCSYGLAANMAGNVTIAGDKTNGVTIKSGTHNIYYTLDGTDPRTSANAVFSSANVTLSAADLTNATVVKAINYDADKEVAYGLMAKATL